MPGNGSRAKSPICAIAIRSASPAARGKGRGGTDRTRERKAGWMAGLLVVVLSGLYFLDLPLHAYFRGEAVRDYLYLHHYGSDRKATELVDTGVFRAGELELLNHRAGSFQSYYAGPLEASRAADTIIGYLRGVDALQRGDYDKLDLVNKIRYQLFVRFGFLPPTHWSRIDPAIDY